MDLQTLPDFNRLTTVICETLIMPPPQIALEEIGFEVKKKRKMRDFIDKNVNAGYNDQMRAADAIPNINLSLPNRISRTSAEC